MRLDAEAASSPGDGQISHSQATTVPNINGLIGKMITKYDGDMRLCYSYHEFPFEQKEAWRSGFFATCRLLS